ncbi:hypothetical protein ACFU99_01295 [Streptomyces sp. NPDC057654]|uniref:hypothetical protein n=1 Tax=Streptomyces sp. NPDC057654 TaxID=3346196 RepID=UPI0036B092D1
MTGRGGPVWRSAARAAAAALIAALLALCGAEPLAARASTATGPAQSAAAVVEAERFTDESATCADGQRRTACPGRAGRRTDPRPADRRGHAPAPPRSGVPPRPGRAANPAAHARCPVLRC